MRQLIESVHALQILDSRGWPTVRAHVRLACGAQGWAAVPSGASTGVHEAHEKRDGLASWQGRGVLEAVKNVNGQIAGALAGMDVLNQQTIDDTLRALDGTPDKTNLGANAMLAVSMACARAGAAAAGLPLYRYLGGVYGRTLPVPMMNILNGGAHAGNTLDVQEFMIRPVGAERFEQAMEMGAAVYRALKGCLRDRHLVTAVGDEGGFAPDLDGDRAALELLLEAIERSGYRPGVDITLALDIAASEWVQPEGDYRMPKSGVRMSREALIAHYEQLCRDFPIDSIEDPLGEEDFEGFKLLSEKIPQVQVVGDDLFTTNPARLVRGMEEDAATAILIKPNQIGTVSETMQCVRMAQAGGWQVVVSHRSGETEDAFIADLAVATNAGQIKAGAPARTDRTAKYNRLLEIADQLD